LKKKKGDFVERTILGIVSFIKETIFSESLSRKNGFLQRRDARFKCVSAALLLLAILFSKNILSLFIIYFGIIVIACFSSIGLLFFLSRTMFFVPLFSFFIVFPAIFNIVTPGEPILSFNFFNWEISITRQGIDSATIFFFRVLDSISVAILLVLTTHQNILLKTLRIFYVPKLIVMIMGMTYRYIFLFLDSVIRTFISIKSRIGFVQSTKEGQRLVAFNMARLWLKSYNLQSQVYNAMISRGYTGEAYVLDNFHYNWVDIVLIFMSLFLLIGTICLNLFFL
jgi:cobalt/nickel transport system permease protein